MQEQDAGAAAKTGQEKKGYVGIHATGFKELMLKPELLQAITDCGFEHPSEGEGAFTKRRCMQALCFLFPCMHALMLTPSHLPVLCMLMLSL